MDKIKIIYKNIDEIIPYVNNPRNNEKAVEKVASSISEFGFKNPIVIDKNGVIINGHTRYKAAKKLKLKEVPTISAEDLTESQIKAFRIADNKTSEFAEWDEELLKLELENLKELDFDIDLLGFSDSDISMLLANHDDFGEDFSLPDGEKTPIQQTTFTLHDRQAELINSAIDFMDSSLGDEEIETFGNTNKRGNLIYMVVKKWAEQKKL